MAAASSSLRRLLLSSSKARLHARPLLASMAKKNAAMAFCTEAPPPRKMARTPSGPVDGEPVRAVWTPVEDEKTGGIYWWNEETDETTEVGAPKPSTYNLSQDPWEEVKDPHTGQSYWWNRITDETTAIGEPKPDIHGRHVSQNYGGGSLADNLKQSLIWGLGISISFGVMSRLFF
uniref:WW domain-containing protein n=1 Tax=Lotharella globosa TaxID=91324 RepID=A0A7S3Y843_9EUKA